jgi:hypothetical protein
MARKGPTDFGALIQAARGGSDAVEPVKPVPRATKVETSRVQNPKTLKVSKSKTSKQVKPVVPARASSSEDSEAGPRFRSFTPKLVLFRDDQLEALTRVARRLSRSKKGGERITENTLVRVAVDFLLAREAGLTGSSEDEIRDGLG